MVPKAGHKPLKMRTGSNTSCPLLICPLKTHRGRFRDRTGALGYGLGRHGYSRLGAPPFGLPATATRPAWPSHAPRFPLSKRRLRGLASRRSERQRAVRIQPRNDRRQRRGVFVRPCSQRCTRAGTIIGGCSSAAEAAKLFLGAARARLVRSLIMPASSSATLAICCNRKRPVAPSIEGKSTNLISTSVSSSFDRKATERVS